MEEEQLKLLKRGRKKMYGFESRPSPWKQMDLRGMETCSANSFLGYYES